MQGTVRDAPDRSRYELIVDEQIVAIADYRIDGEVAVLPHTEVLPHLRGRGLGDQLVAGALDDLRRRGLRVVPRCWFVAEYIEANAEYADLVA